MSDNEKTLTQDEIDEIVKSGKKHVTEVEFVVDVVDGVFTATSVMARRYCHELEDWYIFDKSTRELLEGAAKLRNYPIVGSYKTTTYILDNQHVTMLTDIVINEKK